MQDGFEIGMFVHREEAEVVLTMDIQLCVKMILLFDRVCVGSDWCLGCHMRQNISEPGTKDGKLRIPLTYTDFPSQRTFQVCSFVPIVYNEPTSAQGLKC